MNNIKKRRLLNLFPTDNYRSVIIPIDHGFYMGAIKGLEDPIGMLEDLIKWKVNGTLMSFGLNKVAANYFGKQDYIPKIMSADYIILGRIPGILEGVLANTYYSTVEMAHKNNFDAIKVLFSWGTDLEQQKDMIKYIGLLVKECEEYQMPLMIEPFMMGSNIPKEEGLNSKILVNASRIAVELGADILKVPYLGDKEDFKKITKYSHVPVVILGGQLMETPKDVIKMAKDSVDAGGNGVCFGRNVFCWEKYNKKDIVEALKEIVYKDADVEEVSKKYNLT